MNTRDILNAHLYPVAGQVVRRKSFTYYDQKFMQAGQDEYFFFVSDILNSLDNNKKMPLAGSEVFFITDIRMKGLQILLSESIADDYNSFFQKSYLEITIDGRQVMKIPGYELFEIEAAEHTGSATATDSMSNANLYPMKRELPLPIIINSTSSFEFKFVLDESEVTTNGFLKLQLNGIQLDKLDSFYWDNLRNNQFQQISQSYYYTVDTVAGANTYELFSSANIDRRFFSKTFPLSDIETMSIQNIMLVNGQAVVPTRFNFLGYEDLATMVLRISVDDVVSFEMQGYAMTNSYNCFEFLATTSGVETLAIATPLIIRKSYTLPIPLEIPANSKVRVTLEQSSFQTLSSKFITCILRGVETRRVA